MQQSPKIELMMLNTKNAVILQYEVFFKEIKPSMPVIKNGIPQNIPSPIVKNGILLYGLYSDDWRISLKIPTKHDKTPQTTCMIDNILTEFLLYLSFGCCLPLSMTITMLSSPC